MSLFMGKDPVSFSVLVAVIQNLDQPPAYCHAYCHLGPPH